MNGIHWLKYRRTRTEAFFCFSLTSGAFGALNYVLENELGIQLLFSCYFCTIIHFVQSYYIEYQCRHKFTWYFFSVYWNFSLYSLAIHFCLTVLLVLLYYYRELLSSIISVCSERKHGGVLWKGGKKEKEPVQLASLFYIWSAVRKSFLAVYIVEKLFMFSHTTLFQSHSWPVIGLQHVGW